MQCLQHEPLCCIADTITNQRLLFRLYIVAYRWTYIDVQGCKKIKNLKIKKNKIKNKET